MGRQFGTWFAKLNAEFEHSGGEIVTEAYRDSGGVWTGPGGLIVNPDGTPVQEGQTWTEDEALEIYALGKAEFAEEVDELTSEMDLAPYEFDALGVLAWNIGIAAFARSTVLKELRAGRKESAAAAFLMWRGDTMYGGKPGPDGKPARNPHNEEMTPGEAWFKVFRGIYRRSLCAALLFMGRDWTIAGSASVVKLVKNTTIRRAGYWYDVVDEMLTTSLRDALDVAKPLSAPVAVAPAPVQNDFSVPVDWNDYTDSEKVAWLNTGELRQLQKKGGDPVSAQVVPAKKVLPKKAVRPLDQVEYLSEEAKAAPKAKKVGQSKRGNGFANKKIGGVIGGTTVAAMAAEQIGAVEPVLSAADKYGNATIGYVLLGGLVLAGAVYIWGVLLQRWGEEEADTVLE
tara:strand:- start:4346 stop:5542 length:1197 start_codon:yes stop_codon:yes gene_type:complete